MALSIYVLKICIGSVCVTAAYLTLCVLSSTKSNQNSLWNPEVGHHLESLEKGIDGSNRAMRKTRSNKILCSCDRTGKVNNNKDGSTWDSGRQVTKESVSITRNPHESTTRHVNYFPPDEPRSNGLGVLKLPDSLPWKSLELRLIYVLKVLRRSSKVVNVTQTINDLRGAAQIIEDVHTKLDLAYRSSDPESGSISRDTATPGGLNITLGSGRKGNVSGSAKTRPKPPKLCPEAYKGTLFGYPFYETGWVKENCTIETSVDELVTVIIDSTETGSTTRLNSVVNSLRDIHPGMKILAGIPTNGNSVFRHKQEANVSRIPVNRGATVGHILNTLVSKVTTPYTFVATDVLFMDSDSRLERLTREISNLNVNIAASALKNEIGLWSLNCFQMIYKNYTAVYRAGYHHSQHECVFCNFSKGPFLANTNFLKEHKFDESLPRPVVLRDYFFKLSRLRHKVAVCPDSMQHVASTKPLSRKHWLQLAQKWQMHGIRTEDGLVTDFSCEELKTGCNVRTGRAVSPCCLRELTNDVLFVMRTFRENHIHSELQEGSLLGAVKLGQVLPWERDADISFLSSNFSAILHLKEYFRKHGYSLTVTDPINRGPDGLLTGGTIRLHGTRWPVELWGQHSLQSGVQTTRNQISTKILLHGEAVAVPRNPGLVVRNRYGKEVYQHAQHWMSLGLRNSWTTYQAGFFTRCTQPGHHDCLDQYSADGNLQFSDPIP